MASWDDDDWDAGAAPAAAPAVGAPGVVADSWEDEDESSGDDAGAKAAAAAAAAAPRPSAPMKPSKVRAQAIKAREAADAARARARAAERDAELASASAAERKRALQQLIEEADLDHAKDLFGGAAGDAAGATGAAARTLDNFAPATDAEFGAFAEMLGEKCRTLNSEKRRTFRYVTFVKDVMRELTRDLGPDDVKTLSAHMGLLSNEKREAVKRARGQKKKPASKKSSVKVDSATDMRSDRYDDFDEDMFM